MIDLVFTTVTHFKMSHLHSNNLFRKNPCGMYKYFAKWSHALLGSLHLQFIILFI